MVEGTISHVKITAINFGKETRYEQEHEDFSGELRNRRIVLTNKGIVHTFDVLCFYMILVSDVHVLILCESETLVVRLKKVKENLELVFQTDKHIPSKGDVYDINNGYLVISGEQDKRIKKIIKLK